MKRASELFTIGEWATDSGFVQKAWRTQSEPEPEPAFISIAASRWQLCVTTQRGAAQLTIRGPDTKATITPIPADAEFFGIAFSLGTFMPVLPLPRLVGRSMALPAASPTSFWLDGSRWEIPTPGNADVFVDRLVRHGVVVRDPIVAGSLDDGGDGVSTRTLERHFAQATGLTRGATSSWTSCTCGCTRSSPGREPATTSSRRLASTPASTCSAPEP